MLERWRDIPGWEGYYQASNQGRIRSVDRIVRHSRGGPSKRRGQILHANPIGKYGYFVVTLYKEGIRQNIRVHQLVALTWIGSCPNRQEVRHGPNGATDNSIGNLLYGTHKQNSLDMRRDGTHIGRPVKRSDGIEFINMAVAAEESDCHATNICEVCRGKRRSASGYGWKYIERTTR